jgi:hypothetical protein
MVRGIVDEVVMGAGMVAAEEVEVVGLEDEVAIVTHQTETEFLTAQNITHFVASANILELEVVAVAVVEEKAGTAKNIKMAPQLQHQCPRAYILQRHLPHSRRKRKESPLPQL